MEKEREQEVEAEEEPAAERQPREGGEAGQPPEGGEERPQAREGGEERPRRRGGGRGRRRACVMCVEHMTSVDYKDFGFLRRFLSDRGRMDSRRKTGTCAKHQRALAQAIKRARHLALLPYTAEHIRMGVSPSR